MSSLADLPELVGFFSYSREDDADSNGALSALRSRIQGELRGQLGRTARSFRLWQDKEAIPSGALWETEIKNAVEQSVFFIPIITPTVVASPYCRFELDAFLAREAALGRSDLVFPILYIDVPALGDSVRWQNDAVLSLIAKRQYLDWRRLRHRDVRTTDVSEEVERFCTHIRAALHRPWVSSEERKQQEEAEPQRQAEDEARQKAAQEERQKREAEAEESGKEEADAKRRSFILSAGIFYNDRFRKNYFAVAVASVIVLASTYFLFAALYGRLADRIERPIIEKLPAPSPEPKLSVQPAVAPPGGSNLPTNQPPSCQRIIGAWLWQTGVIKTFRTDGSIDSVEDPGHWTCHGGHYDIFWNSGWIDHMTLTTDGTRLFGKNNIDHDVWANRYP
jgi:TIR domain